VPSEIRQAVDEVVEGKHEMISTLLSHSIYPRIVESSPINIVSNSAGNNRSPAFAARGKKKGIKGLLPLLIAAKVKLGVLATLAYFAIGLIAKKAILASLISLAISAFVGLRSLWNGGKNVYHHDLTAYNNGWSSGSVGGWSAGGWSAPVSGGHGGWSNSGSAGWEDPHAYSHSQAYSGYHH